MKKIHRWRQVLVRSGGPLLSLLLHVLAVYALLHFMVFQSSSTTPDLETKLVQDESLELDEMPELEPVKPLEDVSDNLSDNPEPLVEEVVQQLNEVVAEPALADDLPTVLPADSPLTFKALGGDSQSMSTLKQRYGDRATRNGLLGSYYNSVDFTGQTFMRIDETLNKNWQEASPWPNRVRPDLFSAIWTGRIVPRRSGHYTLYLQSDDGARMWINGKLVLDQLTEHVMQEDKVEIEMLAGLSYDVKYAFCDVYVHAVSRLEWSSADAGIGRELVPTDCMWADGVSTRELLKWNEQSGGRFVNRDRMRNPALLDTEPFSHIVDYKRLNEEALDRLQLQNLVSDFKQFKKTGQTPAVFTLPSGRDESPAEAPSDDNDVKISIL